MYSTRRSFKLLIIFFLFLLISFRSDAQNKYMPAESNDTVSQKHLTAGSFHKPNRQINGLSYGAYSSGEKPRRTTTNGLRLEFPGEGFFTIFMYSDLFDLRKSEKDDTGFYKRQQGIVSEKTAGINISTFGTVGNDYTVSGITLGGIGQEFLKVNGIAIAGENIIEAMNGLEVSYLSGETYRLNGVQIGITNYTAIMHGLQIGIFNDAKSSRGLQIGVWNKNERRSFPIINWNFKSKIGGLSGTNI